MIIRRISSSEFGTFGVFIENNIPFALTLERPWLDNETDVSCIPPGIYTCKRFHSSKHPDTFQIMDVPGRTGVLFHTGNLMEHSAGCVLVGEMFEPYKGEPAILSSKKGFTEFMTKLENVNEFQLLIQDKAI